MSRKGNEIARALCAEIEKGGLPIDTTDWQQVRIQAAIAAMQGQLANDESVKQMIETLDSVALPDKTKAYMNLVARSSVMLADALVAELKKGGQQ